MPINVEAGSLNAQMAIFDPQATILRLEVLLREKRYQELLDNATEAIGLEDVHGKIWLLHAAALLGLGRGTEAEASLRRAVELEPTSTEALFALATFLFDSGKKREAAGLARKILDLDATHREARQLLRRCGPLAIAVLADDASPSDEALETPEHLIKAIESFGSEWFRLGWAIVALGAVSAILWKVHNPIHLPANFPQPGGQIFLERDPLSIAAVLMLVTSAIGSFLFVLIDIIDRRKGFIWVLPMFVCCFCGCQCLPLSLYLFMNKQLRRR